MRPASRRRPSLLLVTAPLAFALLVLARPTPAQAPAAAPQAPPARVVEITAQRFKFTPAEVTLTRGQSVVLRLRSLDVTHGFFSRPLGLDGTIEPGQVLDLPLTPAETGRFTVICDHFCGAGHGNMRLTIVVE
jgi:cytochrome c oxidase subunit 2